MTARGGAIYCIIYHQGKRVEGAENKDAYIYCERKKLSPFLPDILFLSCGR